MENDIIQKIVDCCTRITTADPQRDVDAENELYAIGKWLYGQGYEEAMLDACTKAIDLASTQGKPWGVGPLCNSKWDGIGYWRR